jgi:hypothetical protein
MSFPGLKKGEASCYKNIPYIWTNNSCDILFSKQEGYVQTLMLTGVDQVGETKITHGYVTLEVTVTKSKKQLNASTKIAIDKVN